MKFYSNRMMPLGTKKKAISTNPNTIKLNDKEDENGICFVFDNFSFGL